MKDIQTLTIDTLIEIVTKIGEIAKKSFGKVITINTKSDGTDVTEVDTNINEALKKFSERYSNTGYIAEEGNGDTDKEYILYVDPYDGTSAGQRGMATATVIASLMQVKEGYGIPLMCVIYNFATGEIWSAVKDQGAYKSDWSGGRQIHTTKSTGRVKTAVCAWPGASHNLEQVSDNLRKAYDQGLSDQQMGAFGIGGGFIAQGTLNATACGSGSAVETAAMSLLVTEAGGVAIDLNADHITEFKLGEWKGKADFLLPDGVIIASDIEAAKAFLSFIHDNQNDDYLNVSPDSQFYSGPALPG